LARFPFFRVPFPPLFYFSSYFCPFFSFLQHSEIFPLKKIPGGPFPPAFHFGFLPCVSLNISPPPFFFSPLKLTLFLGGEETAASIFFFIHDRVEFVFFFSLFSLLSFFFFDNNRGAPLFTPRDRARSPAPLLGVHPPGSLSGHASPSPMRLLFPFEQNESGFSFFFLPGFLREPTFRFLASLKTARTLTLRGFFTQSYCFFFLLERQEGLASSHGNYFELIIHK